MNKSIIIEFTWIYWAWKSTFLKQIKEKLNDTDIIYFCDDFWDWFFKDFDTFYLNQNFFKKAFSRLLNIFKNIKLHFYFFVIAYKSKSIKLFNNLSYIKYKYDKKIIKENKVIIFDEFIFHKIIRKTSFLNINNREKIILNILKFFDINPIYFDIDRSTSLERLKNRKRKNSDFDNLSFDEKKELVEENYIIYKKIVKKYCEMNWKNFIIIESNNDINLNIEKFKKYLDILKK